MHSEFSVHFPTHFKAFVCVHIVGEGLAAAHSTEGGRGCGQERVTAAMATDDPSPVRVP